MYRQSLFGYLWAFVPPLLAAVPWLFLNSQKIVNVGYTPIAYPAFVMTGMMLWQSFLDVLNSPLKQTSAARSMLAKINFPREALLLAGLAETAWNLLIRMLLLVPVLWFYGTWSFSAANVRSFRILEERLLAHATPLTAHLWAALSADTRKALQGRSLESAQMQSLLVRDLNRIVQHGPLYDPDLFTGVSLSVSTRQQIAAGAGGTRLLSLNRRLLEEACPNMFVARAPVRSLMWAPAAVGGLMLLGFAVGLLVTPLGLLYMDVGRAIGLAASFGMLLTPIVDPPRTVGLAGWLTRWNPVSPVLVTSRDWLTGQSAPLEMRFVCVTAASCLLLLVAWFLYRLTMPILVERMGG